MVTNLAVRFDTDVSITVSNLHLRNVTNPAPVNPSALALSYDPASHVATWTFPGLPGGSLPDGNYIATVLANTVTNSAGQPLDGNADGLPGDGFTFGLFRFLGDYNADRDVDFWDTWWLRSAGSDAALIPIFDSNGDGQLDASDITAFDGNYFTLLPPQPGIFAGLVNDTGVSAWDRITSDPSSAGAVTETNLITSLRARLSKNADDPAQSLVEITADLDARATFRFDSNRLAAIHGAPLTDGPYVLHLETLGPVPGSGSLVTNSEFNTSFVLDATPPMLAGVPPDAAYQCLNAVPPPPAVTVVDAIDPNPTLTFTETTNGVCPLVITRSWTASDQSGNRVSTNQMIMVHDTIPPVLVGVPADAGYSCLSEVPAPPAVSATDNCDPNLPVSYTVTTNGACPWVLVRTWMAQDACHNPAMASQTITVNDTQPPVLVGVPPDTNYVSLAKVPPPPVVTATDNCTPDILVGFTSVTNAGIPLFITNAWNAVDACSNLAHAVQVIRVQDPVPPDTFITNAPPALTRSTVSVFEFTGIDNVTPPDELAFECRVLSTLNPQPTTPWTNCVSPFTNIVVADGLYTFEVRAIDAAGNADPTPASTNWVVDTTPPAITLDLAPASDSPPTGDYLTTFTNVTLVGQTEPNLNVRLRDLTLGAPGSDLGQTLSDASGQFVFTNVLLALGTNLFTATATDPAGNQSVASLVVTLIPAESCVFDPGLTGWMVQIGAPSDLVPTLPPVPGSVSFAAPCSVVLTEGDSFVVSLERTFVLPTDPALATLQFSFTGLQFDETTTNAIRDAFEAMLVDTAGNPLTYTIQRSTGVSPASASPDSFFNATDGQPPALAQDVSAGPSALNPQLSTVSLSLHPSALGQTARLIFRLINNDRDHATTVSVTDLRFVESARTVSTASLLQTSLPLIPDSRLSVAQAAPLSFNPLITGASTTPAGLLQESLPPLEAMLFAVGAPVYPNPPDQENKIYRYLVDSSRNLTLNLTITNSTFNRPSCFAFSRTAEMFLPNRGPASGGGGSLSRFLNPIGSPEPNGSVQSSAFNLPHDIAFLGDEFFVVNSLGNDILRFIVDSQGNVSPSGEISSGLEGGVGRGIVVAPWGELLVTLCCGADRINRYLIASNKVAIPNGVITGNGLSNPHFMAFSPRGELFVANPGNGGVSRFLFDAQHNVVPNGWFRATGVELPIGIDFSPWGELFVGDHSTSQGRIARWTFDAEFTPITNGVVPVPGGVGSIRFFKLRAQPTIELNSPSNGSTFSSGATVLVSGRTGIKGDAGARNFIVSVTVNARPVEALDASGNFFARISIPPGQTMIRFIATDAFGQTAFTDLTVLGTDQPAGRIDFSTLSDASASVLGEYGRTSFNDDTRTLLTDLAVRNVGQYALAAPLLVGITRLSDPSVHVLNADGITPDGIPYFDYSALLTNHQSQVPSPQSSILGPGEQTLARTIALSVPNRTQFTYDLVILGQLNRAPAFTTVPTLEALVGQPYRYDAGATDPDGDSLTFTLLQGPVAAEVTRLTNQNSAFPNPQSAILRWTPGTNDLGSHNLTLQVSDGRGGSAQQRFVLVVTTPPPNRPPYFTSVPVTAASVTTRLDTNAEPFDLRQWTVVEFDDPHGQGNQFPGNWVVDETGTNVIQTINCRPSILLGDTLVESHRVEGRFGVLEDPDDDYIGFVFGYRDAQHFYLFDWRRATWSSARVGMRVLLVSTDSPVVRAELDEELGATVNLPERLGTLYSNSIPWRQFVDYHFILDFTPGYFAVSIDDGTNVVASFSIADSTFSGGRFGFYNASQGHTRYSGFSRQRLSEPTYTYDANALDPDNDTLTFSLTIAPIGMAIDPATGMILWSPTVVQIGDHNVTVQVSDGRGGIAPQNYIVTVLSDPANHPPIIISIPPTNVVAGNLYAYDVEALDPDADTLVHSLAQMPAGAIIDITNGLLHWATTTNDVGVHPISVRVSDERGGFDTQSYNLEVVWPGDLTIANIEKSGAVFDGQALTVSGTVTATISNLGPGRVDGPFEVLFFEDRNLNGAYDDGADSVLGTTTVAGSLLPGQGQAISATLAGSVLFPGNVIWGFVDSGNAIIETDEGNNVVSTPVECLTQPVVGQFSPVIEWAKINFATLPASRQVLMNPVVGDLDGDGIPEIVVVTAQANDFNGSLRALRGDSGTEAFTAISWQGQISALSTPALGDIDLDGHLEIITVRSDGTALVAFEHDGTSKWTSDPLQHSQTEQPKWGCPAIADIDGDDQPEIIIGRQVLDNKGKLLWTGNGGKAEQQAPGGGLGPLALVADLDMDGFPEVVAGNTAYRNDGSVLWQNASLPDGWNAIGNFDPDQSPEIVLVAAGNVWLLEHTGAVKWGPRTIPGGPTVTGSPLGGAPTVADMDGDGIPEIGIAGSTNYAVFQADGALKWSSITADASSGMTGSSVFDFDGDGSAEIVYRDEQKLRVYRGSDGAILYETNMTSCTSKEYPLICDVDADGNAEIVIGANNACWSGQNGIYVIGDRNDTWVSTRKIWNQHTYHINNVNDDGTIPAHEEPSWLTHNTYRLNAFLPGFNPLSAPDLVACYLRVGTTGQVTSVTARVGNAGAILVGPAVNVAFYDGQPGSGGTLLGVVQTSDLIAPGAFEDVTLLLTNTTATDIWVAADDDGTGHGQVNECNEANNVFNPAVSSPSCEIHGTKFNDLNGDGVRQTFTIGGFDVARAGLFSVPNGSFYTLLRSNLVFNFPGFVFASTSQLTTQFLNTVDALIINTGGTRGAGVTDALTATEQAALLDFVRDGGGAIILVDNNSFSSPVSPDPVNQSFIAPFGVHVIGKLAKDRAVANVFNSTHPLTQGPFGVVSTFESRDPGWFDDLGPNAVGLAHFIDNGGIGLAAIARGVLSAGSGGVVLLSDFNTFDNASINNLDNAFLAPNAVRFVTSAATEPGLPGWVVYLDQNQNRQRDPGERWMLTDVKGTYVFRNLLPGTHRVAEEQQSGWTQTAPASGSYSVTLTNGQIVRGIDFGNQRVTLPPENRPPVFTSAPATNATVGQVYRYDARAVDLDGDALTFDLTVKPSGMIVQAGTGIVVWTPTASQVGLHDVVLRVQDGRGGLALQSFQIQVQPPNSTPVITSQPRGPAYVGVVWQYEVRAQDADGDPITFSLDAGPTGMVLTNPQPSTLNSQLLLWTPLPSQTGSVHVAISARDDRGAATTQFFDLPVVQLTTNHPPTITSTPRTSIGLGATYFYLVEATDPDGDPLTFNLIAAPPGMVFSNSQPSTLNSQLIVWAPTSAQFGSNYVDLQVSDGKATVGQRFPIYVVNRTTNQPPQIVSTPPFAAVVGGLYAYDAAAVDPDGDPMAWSLDTAPTGMSIDPAFGTIRWTPSLSQLGTNSVRVRVVDGQGGSAAQTYSIVVRPVNLAPQIVSVPPTRAATNQLYTYTVRAEDPDGDGTLTWTLVSGPTNMTLVDPQSGIRDPQSPIEQSLVTSAPTIGMEWTPNPSQLGTNPVVIRVEDNQGGVGEQSFQVVVSDSAENRYPVITSTPGAVAMVGVAYLYQVTANDPDGDPLEFMLLGGPAGMTINAGSGLLQWTPTSGQLGSHAVMVGAVDPDGAGGSQNFTVYVTADNHPPTIVSKPVQLAFAGQLYRYDVRATDPDGDPLTFALTGPAGMIIDQLGRVSWTPTVAQAGTNRVSITVTDPYGAFVRQDYDMAVVVDTTPPSVQLVCPGQPLPLGSTLDIAAFATDDSGRATVELTIGGVPFALNANNQTRLLLNVAGTFEMVATATDPAGNRATNSCSLTVYEFINDGTYPEVSITAPADDAVITSRTNVIGTASDTNLLYYTLAVKPLEGDTFTEIVRGTNPVVNDVLGRFDPSTLANDTYVLRLTAVDAGGLTSSAEVTVHVSGELKVGNFRLSFTDLSIPVNGVPIIVGRTYDSLDAGHQGDFGYGWRLEFRDVRLRTSVPPPTYVDDIFGDTALAYSPFNPRTRVYVTLPGGKREGFTFKPVRKSGFGGYFAFFDPAFEPDAGVSSRLSVYDTEGITLIQNEYGEFESLNGLPYNPEDPLNFGGVYYLTTKEGLAYEVDARTGNMQVVTDPNNNKLTFEQNAIISSAGPRVTFTRDPQGRITSVTDPQGRVIRYQYDARGDLVSVTDRETNTTQFAYSAQRPHFLERVIDPLGRTGVRTEYDAQGRLIRLTDAAGNPVNLIHNTDDDIEQVVDALGHTNTFVYDERGNVVVEVNAQGGVTRRSYNANNFMTMEVDALGQTNRFEYDSQGNVIKRIDPLGNETLNTYQEFRPGRFTGMIIGGILPFKRLKTATDPLGNTTVNDYDGNGNVTATTDAAGNITGYAYDSAGNQTAITDAAGNVTRFEYDGSGHLLKQTDALGNVTSYTYDGNGNQLSQTSAVTVRPGVVKTNTTFTTYDANGRPTSATDAAGNVTRTEYDALGNTKATIDALGHRTEFRYDDRGKLIETAFADGTRGSLTYDAAGRRTSSTDRAGRTTDYEYDALGRLVRTIFPRPLGGGEGQGEGDRASTRTFYDLAGRVIAQTDERTNSAWFGYDAAGRQVAVTNALGYFTRSAYDNAGRKIADTDTLGRTAQFIYDVVGRRTQTVFPDGTTKRTVYDSLGRVVAEVDQAGVTNRFEYDALGRLISVIDALGHRTEYGYNEGGNLVRQQDANGHVTRYEYETCCQRSATILPLGQRSTTLYNAVNGVAAVTNFNGDVAFFEYDINNRLAKKSFITQPPTLNPQPVFYGYTPTGRRAAITNSAGVTTWTYDARDRLLSRTDPDGRSIRYEYDAAGNRTKITTLNSQLSTINQWRFTFDALNRLETVIEPDGDTNRYSYDPANNVQLIALANGTWRTNFYDSLNRVTNIVHAGPTGAFASFRYTLAPTGNRRSVQDLAGRTVAWDYDALNRLTRETVTSDPGGQNYTADYVYDAVGNRLYFTNSLEGLTAYGYDDNDQLLTESLSEISNPGSSILTRYAYDANGNTLSRSNATESAVYVWSPENRLIAAEIRSTLNPQPKTLNYLYNDDGIRVAASVTEAGNTTATAYLVDANRPFAQVLEEWQTLNSEPSTLNVSYTYGHQLLSQNRTGVRTYYHADHLGSTRALTGQTGSPTDRYAFDAYGRTLRQTGPTVNTYLFAGEQRDKQLGLDYLRARYLNVGAGRFYGRDPLEGDPGMPASRHRFNYVSGNPVNNVDPSGRITLTDIVAIFSIQENLARYERGTAALRRIQRPKHPGRPFWEIVNANYTLVREAGECCDADTGLPFQNQCAIKMSRALGFAAPGPYTCNGYSYRAEVLANYLRDRWGQPDVEVVGPSAQSEIDTRKGVIFFLNAYSGGIDHIDLWDGFDTKGGDPAFRAPSVWFWELNLLKE